MPAQHREKPMKVCMMQPKQCSHMPDKATKHPGQPEGSPWTSRSLRCSVPTAIDACSCTAAARCHHQSHLTGPKLQVLVQLATCVLAHGQYCCHLLRAAATASSSATNPRLPLPPAASIRSCRPTQLLRLLVPQLVWLCVLIAHLLINTCCCSGPSFKGLLLLSTPPYWVGG